MLAIPVLIGGAARADLNTDEPGSLIVFPKVIADGTRDTIIHLTNTHNMGIDAHCFYTNAYGTCENDPNTVCTSDLGCAEDDECDGQWFTINFDIHLTPQQPTFWRVSTGRGADFFAAPCRMNQTCTCTVGAGGNISCPGFTASTFQGSFVLPMTEQFIGELRCYEVQSLDTLIPMAANKLKGEAFIETLASGEISGYNAIAIQANGAMDGSGLNNDLNLLLNRQNMGAGEYNACGDSVSFTTHGLDSAADILGQTGSTDGEVTLVPCTALFEDEPIPVSTVFLNWDQTELPASQTVGFDCLFNERFSNAAVFGSLYDVSQNPDLQFARTEVQVSNSTYCWTGTNKGGECTTNDQCPGFRTTEVGNIQLGCRPSPGVIGVVEEFYTLGARPEGSAASSVYNLGDRDFDIIVVPPPQGGGGD
jgi:hypothetical protein